MKTLLRAALAVAILAALAAASTASVSANDGDAQSCQEDMACWDCQTMGNRVCGPIPDTAVEPDTLGFAVQSVVYVSDGRDLLMQNRSTVPVLVTIDGHDGWSVDPTELTLAVDESATVLVIGDGTDGGTIDIVATAADRPDGPLATAISLTTHVRYESPDDWTLAIAGIVAGAGAGGVGSIIWWRRRQRPDQWHAAAAKRAAR